MITQAEIFLYCFAASVLLSLVCFLGKVLVRWLVVACVLFLATNFILNFFNNRPTLGIASEETINETFQKLETAALLPEQARGLIGLLRERVGVPVSEPKEKREQEFELELELEPVVVTEAEVVPVAEVEDKWDFSMFWEPSSWWRRTSRSSSRSEKQSDEN